KLAKRLVPSAFEKAGEGSIAKLGDVKQYKLEDTPGFGISSFTALFPVILMGTSTIITLVQDTVGLEDNIAFDIITTLGTPSMVMLLSVLLAIYTMGIARNIPMTSLMNSAEDAVKA